MQIESLAQLGDTYDHVYISPHLDDTVISCGGAVAAQLAAGERVLSVTLSTAAPDPAGPFSALADEFHGQWKLTAAQAVSARLAEERFDTAAGRLAGNHRGAWPLRYLMQGQRKLLQRAVRRGWQDVDRRPQLGAVESLVLMLRARYG